MWGFFTALISGAQMSLQGVLITEVPKQHSIWVVIGAFITITVIQSKGALGPAKAAMLIVISQLIVAYVIELLGMFGTMQQPFEWRKILGMLIAIAGIVIFKW